VRSLCSRSVCFTLLYSSTRYFILLHGRDADVVRRHPPLRFDFSLLFVLGHACGVSAWRSSTHGRARLMIARTRTAPGRSVSCLVCHRHRHRRLCRGAGCAIAAPFGDFLFGSLPRFLFYSVLYAS
jgi:hypothetical protein